jgi:hypothetical protein
MIKWSNSESKTISNSVYNQLRQYRRHVQVNIIQKKKLLRYMRVICNIPTTCFTYAVAGMHMAKEVSDHSNSLICSSKFPGCPKIKYISQVEDKKK